METRRVLVVGNGAREHALAWALSKEGCKVWCAPGNAGTKQCATNLALQATDNDGICSWAWAERPDLVVIGPEAPLSLGLADALQKDKIAIFGPSQAAAELESSKVFMKRLLKRAGVATAAFEVFDDAGRAKTYVQKAKRPLVVKADGLAAGKGVVVAQTADEALEAVQSMMVARCFGEAGRRVVIEEVLAGEEASFHVICDGSRAIALPASQDHKRVRDGDAGPNTGGMGAYAPAPIVDGALSARIMAECVQPVFDTLRAEDRPFVGALFCGLMIDRGTPRVLEFNVRFGDPEATVLIPLLQGSWYEILSSAAKGNLPTSPATYTGHAVSVVMAAENYPATPATGDVITGATADFGDNVTVFHAGTCVDAQGRLLTSGGRVLTVCGRGATLREARDEAYRAAAQIHWRGEHHRSDIGRRALK